MSKMPECYFYSRFSRLLMLLHDALAQIMLCSTRPPFITGGKFSIFRRLSQQGVSLPAHRPRGQGQGLSLVRQRSVSSHHVTILSSLVFLIMASLSSLVLVTTSLLSLVFLIMTSPRVLSSRSELPAPSRPPCSLYQLSGRILPCRAAVS